MSILRVKELESQVERKDKYILELESKILSKKSLEGLLEMAKECSGNDIADDFDFVTPLEDAEKLLGRYT